MSYLIDRKEAIKCVETLFSMGDCYCDKYSIIGMLNGLPSVEPEEKWVLCSERVPDDHQCYLLTEEIHYQDGKIINDVCIAYYDDKYNEWEAIEGEDVTTVNYPVAWKVIKPYQEEK